jgi:hypothetical protein
LVPFQVGLPALDLFPHTAWKKIMVRQLNAETSDRLSYTDPAGVEELRSVDRGTHSFCPSGAMRSESGAHRARVRKRRCGSPPLRCSSRVIRVAIEDPATSVRIAPSGPAEQELVPVPC